MTNATSPSLQDFLLHHSFDSVTLMSLLAVAVLIAAVVVQEVLRVTRPAQVGGNGRILGLVIYPFSTLTVALIVNRFVHLA